MATRVQLTAGCAVDDDIAYAAGIPDSLSDEAKLTRLFAFNAATAEKWFHHDWDGHRVASVCLQRATASRPRAVFALAEDGGIEVANSAGRNVETIAGPGFGVNSRQLGHLRRIREIAGSLYACGGGNQVYRRSDDGLWTNIDAVPVAAVQANLAGIVGAVKQASGSVPDGALLAMTNLAATIGGFSDIDGASADDIYACGMGGSIWHWNGVDWRQIPSPTDAHLHSIHVVSTSDVLISGHHGTLLRGNGTVGFSSLIGADVLDNFWAVRDFRGRVYLGASGGLFLYEAGGISRRGLPKSVIGHAIIGLDSSERSLWAFGDRHLVRMQNDAWEEYAHPDNA